MDLTERIDAYIAAVGGDPEDKLHRQFAVGIIRAEDRIAQLIEMRDKALERAVRREPVASSTNGLILP